MRSEVFSALAPDLALGQRAVIHFDVGMKLAVGQPHGRVSHAG